MSKRLKAKYELYDNSTLLKLKEQYLRRMWITKKSRINASQRLLDNYWFTQFVTAMYSILLIILTLLSLDPTDTKSKLLLCASITLAVFTVYGIAKNYQERHIRMKDNYIKISNIESQLKAVQCNFPEDEMKVSGIIKSYEALMSEVENHLPVDYLPVKKSTEEEDNPRIKIKVPKGYYVNRMKLFIPKIIIVFIWFIILITFLLVD